MARAMATRLARPLGVAAVALLIAAPPVIGEDDGNDAFNGQLELLYRTVSLDGSREKYDYDFAGLDGGTRLGSTFMEWRNAASDYVDYARVDLLGLGGEPFESAGFTMGRKDSYKLGFTHTKQRYVYDLYDVTNDVDGNSWETENRRTGLDLTLNVTPNIDVLLQYNDQDRSGAGLEVRRLISSEFFRLERPVDFQVRRYGAGFDLQTGPARIYFLQEFRRYEDQQDFFTDANNGLDTTNTATIDTLTWMQNDRGEANLTTLNVFTPLGERVDLAASFYGTVFGDETIESRVSQNGSGIDSGGAPWSWANGFSAADIEQKTLVGEVDLSVAIVRALGVSVGFRSLSQDAESSGAKDLTGSGTVTPQSSSYDYSMNSATIMLEGDPTGTFRYGIGYRMIDRKLDRSSSRSTSGGRNVDFESDGDGSAVLSLAWRPLRWMRFEGQVEQGSIERPLTTVSPYEIDYGRLSATFDLPANVHLDVSYGSYENRQDALQFGGRAESDVGSIGIRQEIGRRISYMIRYSMQQADSRYATSTSLDAAAETRFQVDNSTLYLRFDAQFDPQWSMFVSLVGTESDGSNPFLGPNFEAAVTQVEALAPFVQDYDDLEIGMRYRFVDGPFVGLSLRAFEYTDTFFPQTGYDGTIATFSAGFDF